MRHVERSLRLICSLVLISSWSNPTMGQAASPAKPSAQKPLPAGPPSPQSKHYPILLLVFGNEPNWSLRIGQKGPERMDRPGYPPIPLEAADVTYETQADSWTYHAKDSATGALVAVHLSREACTDAKNDTLTANPPLGGKYAFRTSVEHAQLGSFKGCGRIAAELFPKINNQPDAEEDDEKKKPPPPTITNFKAPVFVAYLNSAGSVVLGRGATKKVVAPAGSELALSHDGKKLLYARSDSTTTTERTLVLYDFDTGKSTELMRGYFRQTFWSPDDSRIAFLKPLDRAWQVWVVPTAHPESATLFSPQPVGSLHGWTDNHTVLATDGLNAYWLSEEALSQAESLRDIYGPNFQIQNSDTLRSHPLNSDLLLVSAAYATAPRGTPVDSTGLANSFFLYELRSKRRSTLCPPDQAGRAAEWSRDGLQVFFSSIDSSKRPVVNRIFWDGTSVVRTLLGSNIVIGQ